MEKPFRAMRDVEVVGTFFPISGMGVLPVNAFVIKGKEPVLVDTGLGMEREEFMKALEEVIDPVDLKWVWVTHDDADHVGNIQEVVKAASGARIVVNSLASLRMSSAWDVPIHRVYWLNAGESIWAGDRKLTAVRPPLFDNPTTIGVYDNKSEAFFSADCFGGLIPEPAETADDVAKDDLVRGMVSWASLDAPWVYMTDRGLFGKAVDKIRQIGPKMIFSGHLPPAWGRTEEFLELLGSVPDSTPMVAPNQATLEQMLLTMKSGR